VNWGGTFTQEYGDKNDPNKVKEVISVVYPHCNADTDAKIISKFITNSFSNEYIQAPEPIIHIYNFFLRCTRCESAILLLWSFGNGFYGREQLTAGRATFPLRVDRHLYKDLEEGVIPKAIFIDVTQAELSISARSYYGAGLLFRRAIQNICRDKNCNPDDGLNKQIDNLVSNALITQDMADLAHTIKIVGNELAHPDPNKPFVIDHDDIIACKEFIEQLLMVLYISPFKAKKRKDILLNKGVDRK
jgi:hypothetical protein